MNKFTKITATVVIVITALMFIIVVSFGGVMLAMAIFLPDDYYAGPIEGYFVGIEYSSDEIETKKKNIDLVFMSREPEKYAIGNFDVNEKGEVAVASKRFDTVFVCVYDNHGKYKYGYSFECLGSAYVEWEDGYLGVYNVRADSFVKLDDKGNVVGWISIDDSKENNSHKSDITKMKHTTVNGEKYSLRNKKGPYNLIATTYTQIVVCDGENERIIYDVNTKQLILNVFSSVFLILFFVFVFIGTGKLAKRNQLNLNSKK